MVWSSYDEMGLGVYSTQNQLVVSLQPLRNRDLFRQLGASWFRPAASWVVQLSTMGLTCIDRLPFARHVGPLCALNTPGPQIKA